MGGSYYEWRQLVTVLIRTASGQQLRSGVLAAEAAGGLWVASNRHVVAEQGTVCVVKADRSAAATLGVPLQSKQKHRQVVLALIWLPNRQPGRTKVAIVSERATTPKDLPVVR